MPDLRLRRRQFLGVAATGLAAGAGVSAGCTDTSGVSDDGAGEPSATGTFDLPDSGIELPTDPIKLTWMDSGDQKAFFFKPFFAAYHDKHDNITIDYTGSNWSQIQQVIGVGIRNGSAPDVFQLPAQIPIPTAVASGWIGAYDDLIPDLPAVKKGYPPGVFADGITDFNGKTYAIPLVSAQRFSRLLMFNRDHAEQADLDLDQVITWDDFRAALQKLTATGDGDFYGIVMSLDGSAAHLTDAASTMAEMAGVHGGIDGIDWRTGEYNFTQPIAIEAIELFLAIQRDGSFFPDSPNLDDAGARGRMPQGAAGVIFDGPWDIDLWHTENPDFNLGLNLPPQRDPEQIWPHTYAPGGAGKWVYKAQTDHATVIGDIFAYLTTEAAQARWATLDRAADPPPLPQAIEHAELSELGSKALHLAREHMVIRPEPSARNPDVSTVYLEQHAPQPAFSDVAIGLLTGQIDSSVPAAMQDLKDRYDASLDDAIAAAKKKGAKVSRDDWIFADWDPRRPYEKLYRQ